MFGFLKSITSQPRAWRTPDCNYWKLYDEMAQQPHLLIAGATGSGKSVVANGIIAALLRKAPTQTQFIMIDPKRVELLKYKLLPHVVEYATEPADMIHALQHALEIIDRRYQEMARKGLDKYDGGDLYVIIDELADLLTTNKRQAKPLIQRICQIGRASKVHLIGCTQCPLSSILDTPIKCNLDSRVGLRTRCEQDSRNILGVTGCETLPRYGQGYFMTPEGIKLYSMPFVTRDEINALVDHWTTKKCWA